MLRYLDFLCKSEEGELPSVWRCWKNDAQRYAIKLVPQTQLFLQRCCVTMFFINLY